MGPGWRRLRQKESDRHQPGLQPEELWRSLQGWDRTNSWSSATSRFLLPLSPKERRRRNKKKRSGEEGKDEEGGEERVE